jgi:predicted aldo/keto reductase-like oxidoreductase
MRFTLSHPEVTTLLCGFSDVAHVEEAVACAGAGPLDPDDERRMQVVWRNNFAQ